MWWWNLELLDENGWSGLTGCPVEEEEEDVGSFPPCLAAVRSLLSLTDRSDRSISQVNASQMCQLSVCEAGFIVTASVVWEYTLVELVNSFPLRNTSWICLAAVLSDGKYEEDVWILSRVLDLLTVFTTLLNIIFVVLQQMLLRQITS